MQSFDEIYQRAAGRKGGPEALEALVAEWRSKSPDDLAATPGRPLAGRDQPRGLPGRLQLQVIASKWPGFEAAFHGFDVALNAAMSDDELDAHLKDTRIVRNGQKVASVRANALFLQDLAREHGSAAAFFAGWPDSDFVGLLEVMKQRAARCAGETAMRVFRAMGKPAFITSRDVSAALIEAGVLSGPPKNRKDLSAVQAAFNAWAAESGRDLTAISRVLAMSAGPIYEPGQMRPPPGRSA